MKGLRDPHVSSLLRSVRARLGGGGIRTICDLAGVGRCHVSQMLNGRGTRGRDTWARVRRHLTAAEWSLVEQSAAWNNFRQRRPMLAAEALRVPLCDDARWPLMPVVCCVCRRGMGAKSCVPFMAGLPSHGYCESCAPRRLVLAGKTFPDDDAAPVVSAPMEGVR